MKTNIEMNIPVLSVNMMVDRLSSLYISAINASIPFKGLPSVFLWGPPGVGKSDGVRQIADSIAAATGKTVTITDIRLLLFSPIDLRGVPMADQTRQFTEWLRPKIFDLDASEKTVNIIFLDELSAAPQSVQAAAYQITLDRTVGEHKLPENTIILAAGNRTTDKSVAFRMPNALANRMMHFQIDVDFDSWRIWAVRERIHPLVLGYLSYDPSQLYHEPEGKDEVAYPTPRTWAFLSNLLFASKIDTEGSIPADIHHLIGGCIGIGAAVEFEAWCNIYRDLPSAADIYAGKNADYPRKPDVLYALISSMVFYASKCHSPSRTGLENACRYAAKFPMDFATVFYKDLVELPGMKEKLLMIPEFKNWMSRQSRVLQGGE